MNDVSLAALVAGIGEIILDPRHTKEEEARDEVKTFIDGSDWAEEANTFRSEDLKEAYFFASRSIEAGLTHAMKSQIARLAAANVTVVDTAALTYFDAAVLWIDPEPADEFLASILGFDLDDGDDGDGPKPRPSWALGSASFGL